MWMSVTLNPSSPDYPNVKYIIEHGTPKADYIINDPQRSGYFTLFWKDATMDWSIDFMSKIVASQAAVATTVQDESMVEMEDGLVFANLSGLWTCSHPSNVRCIGTGATKGEAFHDYQKRSANGWYEVKLARVLAGYKRGIDFRQSMVDQARAVDANLEQDKVDFEDFKRLVIAGNFLIAEM